MLLFFIIMTSRLSTYFNALVYNAVYDACILNAVYDACILNAVYDACILNAVCFYVLFFAIDLCKCCLLSCFVLGY